MIDKTKGFAATLALALLLSFSASSHASLGTNFSDQWWKPDESG